MKLFQVEKIVHRFVCYGRSRFVRKAALSVLRELKTSNVWKDYFILMDVLEEPQVNLADTKVVVGRHHFLEPKAGETLCRYYM